jgi:hypothetical protein
MSSGVRPDARGCAHGILTMLVLIAAAGAVRAADGFDTSANARAADAAADAASDADSSATENQMNELVVTGVGGSHPRPNRNNPVPLDKISAEQINPTRKTGV